VLDARVVSALRAWAWPAAAMVLGALMLFRPILLEGRAQNDVGDTRLNHWILEHGYRWLAGDPSHARFWDPPIFYPTPNVSAYGDLLVGTAPPYWLARALGAGPDPAYQVWLVSLVLTTLLAAYLWLERGLRPVVALGPLPAAAGAFLFACGAARSQQLGHAQLLPHAYTVVALYALTRLFGPPPEGGSALPARGWLGALFGSIVLQLYAGFYLGWFLVLGLAVAAAWALVLPAARGELLSLLRRERLAIAAMAVGAAALLEPMASHYLLAARTVGTRSFELEIVHMVPRPQSWFYVGHSSWWYGWQDALPLFRDLPARGEHAVGLGLLTTTLAVVGLVKARGALWVRLLCLCALTLLLALTMLPGEVTAWQLLHRVVPGGGAVRAISRAGLMLAIPACVGVALLLARLDRRVAAALALACALEQGRSMQSYDQHAVRAQVAALAARVPRDCAAFYVVDPTGAPMWSSNLDAMWAQLDCGIPTVNGYAGNFPLTWVRLYDNQVRDAADRARLADALDAWARLHGLEPRRVVMLEAGRPP
jgi:hypothetical protein